MHTERGFYRLVNFSDAVVAIAITLLILPLVETATELSEISVIQLLEQDGSKLLVFVISFAVIGRFWLAHHRVFENIQDYTPGLMWVNLAWLLTIVFLPFPTELIATDGGSSGTTSVLYIGTMVLTSFTSAWMQLLIVRHPQLQREEIRGTVRMRPAVIALALMGLALLITVVFPSVGLFALFAVALTGPIQRLLRVRDDRARPTAAG